MAGIGEALALVSGFSFAAGSVAVAKGSRTTGGDNGALLSVIVTALAAAGVWIVLAQDPLEPFGRRGFLLGAGWFALSGVLTIVLGRALLYRSIGHLGAVRASAIKRLNPFFSVFLAALLLGEAITPLEMAGIALIGASFVVLIRESLDGRAKAVSRVSHPGLLTYSYGPASALCYALGYIARKSGLDFVPDSNFGTLVGALAGLFSYFLAAALWSTSRETLAGVFADATRWQFVAAIFVSVGQLAQFAAIRYIEISRVVMISSLEIFFAMLLSVYVLRTETRPSLTTILAAITAVAGAMTIALA
jgi:drug/metabolite transporter (DMT)-like permease